MSAEPPLSAPLAELEARLRRRDARVGVIGMGYVGLPLALALVESGFDVVGFDVDPAKVEALEAGRCYIRHLDPARVGEALASRRFGATSDFARLGEPDALLICVPTPLSLQRDPDLSFVEATGRAIAETLRRGQLVVLESTTYPGTTRDVLAPILATSGLEIGRDFALAFSPEREDPGNPEHTATRVPKVVGGVDAVSTQLAGLLYEAIVPRVVAVSSAEVAEASKLTENVFRAVNIALVNELKAIYDRMGIDVWEVLDAAATKPFGFMRFDPGPGWGGHCIPLDPFYLTWKAREHKATARFIELAGEINQQMAGYVVDKLARALNRHGKPVHGSSVLVLGLAYKRDVDDPRESPAFELVDQLLELGAKVDYHDPHIPQAPLMRTWPELPPMSSVELTPERLAGSDAVLLVTDHTGVDYERVLEHAPLVVDTRGVYRAAHPKVVKA